MRTRPMPSQIAASSVANSSGPAMFRSRCDHACRRGSLPAGRAVRGAAARRASRRLPARRSPSHRRGRRVRARPRRAVASTSAARPASAAGDIAEADDHRHAARTRQHRDMADRRCRVQRDRRRPRASRSRGSGSAADRRRQSSRLTARVRAACFGSRCASDAVAEIAEDRPRGRGNIRRPPPRSRRSRIEHRSPGGIGSSPAAIAAKAGAQARRLPASRAGIRACRLLRRSTACQRLQSPRAPIRSPRAAQPLRLQDRRMWPGRERNSPAARRRVPLRTQVKPACRAGASQSSADDISVPTQLRRSGVRSEPPACVPRCVRRHRRRGNAAGSRAAPSAHDLDDALRIDPRTVGRERNLHAHVKLLASLVSFTDGRACSPTSLVRSTEIGDGRRCHLVQSLLPGPVLRRCVARCRATLRRRPRSPP